MRFFPVTKYRVIGESMKPTLPSGSSVLACHIAYLLSRPKKGHIVVLKHPGTGRVLIKRIVETQDNKLYVLGDNSMASDDSRQFGWIDKKNIVGKVFYRLGSNLGFGGAILLFSCQASVQRALDN